MDFPAARVSFDVKGRQHPTSRYELSDNIVQAAWLGIVPIGGSQRMSSQSASDEVEGCKCGWRVWACNDSASTSRKRLIPVASYSEGAPRLPCLPSWPLRISFINSNTVAGRPGRVMNLYFSRWICLLSQTGCGRSNRAAAILLIWSCVTRIVVSF